MAVFLGALCVALIAAGSSVFTTGNMLLGMVLMAIGAAGLGTMFAAFQSAAAKGAQSFAFDSRDGLTLDQLWKFLHNAPGLDGNTRVYVGDQGINVAGGLFNCLLDGRKALVIERKRADEETMQEIIHPFEGRD